jgi:hypothetical protein
MRAGSGWHAGRQRQSASTVVAGIYQLVMKHAVIRVTDDQLAGPLVLSGPVCEPHCLLERLARHPFASTRQGDLPHSADIEIHMNVRLAHRRNFRGSGSARAPGASPDTERTGRSLGSVFWFRQSRGPKLNRRTSKRSTI